MICNKCKQEKKDCSYQPTCSSLLFGGYQQEYRCQECENKVIEWIRNMLKK